MAQILKEEVRQRIVSSAKEEFLSKGYRDTSMRDIARKSQMTVGNLYRYFKNKEDINLQIVSETLVEIEEVLSRLTENSVSFEARVFHLNVKVEELVGILDKLAGELVSVFVRHPIEFRILMLRSKINEEITDWFSEIVASLIKLYLPKKVIYDNSKMLADSYAISIFAGLRNIFTVNRLKEEELTEIVKVYFHSYVHMLTENDGRM